MSIIGQKLKQLRKELGCTQRDIAQYLNVVDSCYANWEQERTEPNIESLKKLANFFQISINELLENEYYEKKENNSILSDEEKELIKYFRQCDEGEKSRLLGNAQIYAEKNNIKGGFKNKNSVI